MTKRTRAERARLGYEDEPVTDYAVSPLFRAYHAEQGDTKRLPDGYGTPARFEPLPIVTYNEAEFLRDQEELARLLDIAERGLPPPPPPMPPSLSSPPPPPAAKLRGRWRGV